MEKTEKRKRYRSKKAAERTTNTVIYIILTVISVIWLFPFFYLVLQSLRGGESGIVRYFWPKEFTFDNYIRLFTDEQIPFGKWYLNTLLISIAVTVVQTVVVVATSYALSRLRFKFRKGIMQLFLILGMFPGFMSMTAIYFILKLIGLSGSLFGLFLVYVGSSAMGYYICKGFFDTIPVSLDEAARIDGATRHQIFIKVILPLSKPIIIYTILTAFMAPWGEYMFSSLIMLGSDGTDSYNVAMGLRLLLQTEYISDYFTVFCAGAVFVSIPITILFFILQKYYVQGITGGSVKG